MCIIFYKIIHQMSKEFTILGYEMEKISIFFGLFLLFWGIVISALSQSDSITSYIPSFFGLPLILFGFLSLRLPNRKKLLMHIVVLFGFIIFLGGLDVLRSFPDIFSNFWGDLSKIMLVVTGFIFTYLNIKSFIFARKKT